MHRNKINRGTYLDPLGYLGDGRGQQQRGGHDGETGVEMQLSQPHLLEAQFIRQYSLSHSVLVAHLWGLLLTAGQLIKNAKFHFNIPKSNTWTNWT